MEQVFLSNDAETRRWAESLASRFHAGDTVLLRGELGAGKTTWVRGLLHGIGYDGPVRSPTFNLIQTFETRPPVMHADLYRVSKADGIGLEDYFESHLCLIEWPDRLHGLIDAEQCWRIQISFHGTGRTAVIEPPLVHVPTQDSA